MFSKANPAELLVKVGLDGYVSADDVLYLRRSVFHDGVVSPEELDALFMLGERAPEGDPDWPMFFEEALADFYLREEEPHGYITDDEFQSLKARVVRDGEKASLLETGLLVKLIEKAEKTPEAMAAFTADQLRSAIVFDGRADGVSVEETALVRRYVFAVGGDGNVAVTRREAELLFDINDATARLGNDPAWTEFFVKAIAAHLMAHFSYEAPDREEARRRHAFMSDHSVSLGGFFKRMVAGGLSGLKEDGPTAQAERNAQRDADIAAAEQVTPVEADWLADRIGRDGALDASEQKLVAYIRELGADLPPNLKAIVDRAA